MNEYCVSNGRWETTSNYFDRLTVPQKTIIELDIDRLLSIDFTPIAYFDTYQEAKEFYIESCEDARYNSYGHRLTFDVIAICQHYENNDEDDDEIYYDPINYFVAPYTNKEEFIEYQITNYSCGYDYNKIDSLHDEFPYESIVLDYDTVGSCLDEIEKCFTNIIEKYDQQIYEWDEKNHPYYDWDDDSIPSENYEMLVDEYNEVLLPEYIHETISKDPDYDSYYNDYIINYFYECYHAEL